MDFKIYHSPCSIDFCFLIHRKKNELIQFGFHPLIIHLNNYHIISREILEKIFKQAAEDSYDSLQFNFSMKSVNQENVEMFQEVIEKWQYYFEHLRFCFPLSSPYSIFHPLIFSRF